MSTVGYLDSLYTSAPILDYEEAQDARPEAEEVHEAPGVMTLAPESFDAAILEALVRP